MMDITAAANAGRLEAVMIIGGERIRCQLAQLEVTNSAAGSVIGNEWVADEEIRATIYRSPVTKRRSVEGGILGAALLAQEASGWIANTADGAERLGLPERRCVPDGAPVTRHEAQYADFCRLHDVAGRRLAKAETGGAR